MKCLSNKMKNKQIPYCWNCSNNVVFCVFHFISMFFILDFGTVPTVWYLFIFHFIRQTFHITCTLYLCLFSVNIKMTHYYICMEYKRERERDETCFINWFTLRLFSIYVRISVIACFK